MATMMGVELGVVRSYAAALIVYDISIASLLAGQGLTWECSRQAMIATSLLAGKGPTWERSRQAMIATPLDQIEHYRRPKRSKRSMVALPPVGAVAVPAAGRWGRTQQGSSLQHQHGQCRHAFFPWGSHAHSPLGGHQTLAAP